MSVTFRHEGERADYTPVSAVAAGDVVVQGLLVGVATNAIAAGEKSSLAIAGVFRFPKAAGVTFGAGERVYWDGSTTTKTAGGNDYLGLAEVEAASAALTVDVILNANPDETVGS